MKANIKFVMLVDSKLSLNLVFSRVLVDYGLDMTNFQIQFVCMDWF